MFNAGDLVKLNTFTSANGYQTPDVYMDRVLYSKSKFVYYFVNKNDLFEIICKHYMSNRHFIVKSFNNNLFSLFHEDYLTQC